MTKPKIVAIHQPNIFPWLGYFDKLARVDVFIFLDAAQFPKTGGVWTNRCKLLIHGQAAWVTLPIVRAYHGVRQINEMEINESTPWRDKLLKTIQMNYAHAPFSTQTFPFIKELINDASKKLVEFNLNAINALVEVLGLSGKELVLQSSLTVDSKATDLLIGLTRAVGGAAYLCGGGAEGYQEDNKFSAAGIELIYQNYHHPAYPQKGVAEFVPGLSVIDVLMNCGFDGTKHLIMDGNDKGK